MTALSVASYNIHRSIGTDGRCDSARVARVIENLSADVIGLQEIASKYRALDGADHLECLSRLTGYQGVAGATLHAECGYYGNALLTRLPIRDVRKHCLTIPGREPRGALDVDLEADGQTVRVIVTHFGLNAVERALQSDALIRLLDEGERERVVVLADLNAWEPRGRSVRNLFRHFPRGPSPRTYPSWLPLLPLDRILTRNTATNLEVHLTPDSRRASDHLPVRAKIAF